MISETIKKDAKILYDKLDNDFAEGCSGDWDLEELDEFLNDICGFLDHVVTETFVDSSGKEKK